MRQPPKVVWTYALFIILVTCVAALVFVKPAAAKLDDRTTFALSTAKIAYYMKCRIYTLHRDMDDTERATEVAEYERLIDMYDSSYRLYKVFYNARAIGYLHGVSEQQPSTKTLKERLAWTANDLYARHCNRLPAPHTKS